MKIHITQKGDTLWNIAKKYGVAFEELKKANAQLSNPDMIMPGMKIKVPGTGVKAKKEMPVKEYPKKEYPTPAPKKEHPVMPPKKEVPKEKPYHIYQPIMPTPHPQALPEIDINNYYLMNMQQTQQQVSMPPKEAPIHKEEESSISYEMPAVAPMPMLPSYPCPPVIPCYDPCYQPYSHQYSMPMMPYGQGMMPMMAPAPVQQMPTAYPTAYPTAVPGGTYPGVYGQGESSDLDSHQIGGVSGHMESSDLWHQAGGNVDPMVSYGSYQQPYFQPATQGDCGCGGHSHPYSPYGWQAQQWSPMPFQGYTPYPMQPYPMGTASPYQMNAYAMPMRNEQEEEDE